MSIKNIIPRNSGEGGLGTTSYSWGQGVFDSGIFYKNIFVDGSGTFKQDLIVNGSGITELISSKATGDISSHLENFESSIFNTGQDLESKINATGYVLKQAINQTGFLINNIDNTIETTGSILEINMSNLSGSLSETGNLLQGQTLGISGLLVETGNLLQGETLEISGLLVETGNLLQNQISNNPGGSFSENLDISGNASISGDLTIGNEFIVSSGKVGINTMNPDSELDVHGSI